MSEYNKNENIVAYIMYIIIGFVILSVIFIIFISNNQLFNNTSDEQINVKDSSVNEENNVNDNSNIENKNTDQNSQNVNKSNEEDINISKPENKTQNITQNTPPKEIELSSYSTTLYDKEQTRIQNIKLAISKLNGIIIENGSEFSFNNTIGPMNENNGFKKATGFDTNGRKIKISGGGICQISSTLYNAALIAKLNITERHPHSRRVYYVPKDKDATIFYGSLDLKFINTSGSKVKIFASSTNTTVSIKLIKIT